MRKILMSTVLGLVMLVMSASPALALADMQLKHVCSEPSGKELFRVFNNENRSMKVNLVTAFDRKRVKVGPLAVKTVEARVSQGSKPVAKLKRHGNVIDKINVHYRPCGAIIAYGPSGPYKP